MRIDVHAHHYPEEYLKVLEPIEGETVRRDPATTNQAPLDERAGMLKEAGVDLQVLSAGSHPPYGNDEAACVSAARVVNDAYAAAAASHKGRYAAFGSVPLPHVDASIAETARCLDELGMLGINLGCSIGEQTLDDAAFEPLWEDLDHRRAVVFLHPIFRATDAHLRDFDLARMAGACFEDTLAALRLVLSGLTERHPNVEVIVPHFGGTLPIIYPRIARRGKAELLRRLHYDTANGYGPALVCACQALGADRLMLGTDFPYIGSIRQNVDYVLQAGLSQEETDQIMDRNAARLLKVG